MKNNINQRFNLVKNYFNLHSWIDFAKFLGTKGANLYTYRSGKVEVPKEILAIFKNKGINPEWIETGEGSMLIEESLTPTINNHSVGVPFYEIDVTGSIVESFNDIVEKPAYYINFKPFNDCIAYFEIYGNSMYPAYQSGEIIAVKQIANYNVLLWGEAYMIVTGPNANNLKTIKRIFQHNDDDKIILRASNPSYPGDTVIEKKDIIGIYIVKGKISKNMI